MKRVALVHEWLYTYGGAERVLAAIHELFPDAPVYTSIHDPAGLPAWMNEWDIRPSFLQRVPFASRIHRPLYPLMPFAFENFDLREYDLVISSSWACAKGVLTRSDAHHVCYCHTPPRYLWDLYQEYAGPGLSRALVAPVFHYLRLWDRLAADRVDHYLANSTEVARRIEKHYRRDAHVLFPPVAVDALMERGEDEPELPPSFLDFSPADEPYYVIVGRLVGYKRVDLAIEATGKLGRRLVVVGDGPERRRLERAAGPLVSFVGTREFEELRALYRGARALLMPAYEDFGITPVEAQATGTPVIAYRRGGASDTVIPERTGLLFEEQTPASLIAAMEELEARQWDASACIANARRFSSPRFHRQLIEFIEERCPGVGELTETRLPEAMRRAEAG